MAGIPVYTVGANCIVRKLSGTAYDVAGDYGYWLGGAFTAVNEFNLPFLAIIDRNGYVNPIFNPGTGFSLGGVPSNAEIKAVCNADDGRVVVGGIFDDYNGTTTNNLVVLNEDGTVFAAFDPGANNSGDVSSITRHQLENRWFFAGGFQEFMGDDRDGVGLIDETGTFDTTTFVPSTILAHSHYACTALESGLVVCVGVENLNAVPPGKTVTKYNANGTVNSTFNTNVGSAADGTVKAICPQSDGNFLIGGNFTHFNGTAINYLARLSAAGVHDTTYDALIDSVGFDIINSIGTQSNDSAIVVGQFENTWGADLLLRRHIAKLTKNAKLLGGEI